MNLRKPFSPSPAVGGSGRLAARKAFSTPSVPPWHQMPSICGREGSTAAALRSAVAESHMPVNLLTTVMPGCFFQTSSAPLLRSASTKVPATPVTMMTLPLPPIFSATHSAPIWPNLYWLVLTFSAVGAVTTLSNDTTRMPRLVAWRIMPFSPVGEAALMMIASTRSAIRLDICCDCLETSLPELNQEPFTSLLYGSISSPALNRFSISMRHLFPI